MQFHLDHTPAAPGFEIAHQHKLFLTGSCFSENIGGRLQRYKFRSLSSPSGSLFNPLSIYQDLLNLAEQKTFDEKHILELEGLFYSYQHHSSIYGESSEQLADKINASATAAVTFLKEAEFLFITFGTAYAYRHLELSCTVANCHKQPGQVFEKKLTGAEQIVSLYNNLIQRLKDFNPKLRIIFTVSPVKYLKDGLVENTRSKSILHLSVQQLVDQHPNCFYFPAFELVSDDLRDYRFYKKDLAHPNEAAIDYVWQKFAGCFFSEATQTLNRRLEQLHLAQSHRMLNAASSEAVKHQQFISKLKAEITKDHPGLEQLVNL